MSPARLEFQIQIQNQVYHFPCYKMISQYICSTVHWCRTCKQTSTVKQKRHIKCNLKHSRRRPIFINLFIPEAILASGYCRHLRLSVCVHVCMRLSASLLSLSAPYSSPVQAGITQFGPEVQNTLLRSLLF